MCTLVAGHLMLPLSAAILWTLSSYSAKLVITLRRHCLWTLETSNLSLIHHISSLLRLWLLQKRVHNQEGLTWLQLWPCAANSAPSISPLVHILKKSSPCILSIANVCLLLSLWWCDGNKVLYCKTVYSAFSPVPCSCKHQPLKQK